MGQGPLVYLIAGEPSGDAIAGRLMAALREETAGQVRFTGIGGTYMEEEGLRSLFPIAELSVMGLVEVLPHARRILRRIGQIADDVRDLRPDVVVSVDSPSFAIRVARRLARDPIPRVHVVAPTVWAWRPGRVHKFKRCFDHLLAILPFEPPWFERVGLPCHFIGHPVLEYGADRREEGRDFRADHGIGPDERLICVLLGSRRGEVTRLAAEFGKALKLFERANGAFRVVLPTVSAVADLVRDLTSGWPGQPIVVEGSAGKYPAMQASDIALAASGTVALELAIAGVPTVIAYRVAPLTAFIARRLIKVRYVNLVNILLDREVVPEKIQEHCRAEALALELQRLAGPDGVAQIAALQPALDALGRGGVPPSTQAARLILSIAGKGPVARQ